MSYPLVDLGTVVNLQAGIGFPTHLQGKSLGDFPFAKVGDISRNGRTGKSILRSVDNFIDQSDIEILRAKIIPVGSILFAKIGEAIKQNHRVIAHQNLLIDNNAMAAIPSEKIDNLYLYYFLKQVDFYRLAPATTVPALRKSDLEKIKIPFPPLLEQRRIAAILDKADELRQNRQQTIEKLDQLLQATFIEMFGDPISNPKGWMRVTFGDLIKLKSGNGLTNKDMNGNGPYEVYGGNGVTGKHDKYMFKESKITIGRVGQYCGSVHKTSAHSWITDNALYVDEHLKEVNIDFLQYILSLANLNQYAGRAAQPLVSGSRIYPVESIYPPIELQNLFALRIKKIKGLFDTYSNSLNSINDLFSSLQHQAFNGTL